MQSQTTTMIPANGRSLARKAITAVGLGAAALPFLLLFLLRPLVLVRFGAFRSERIGHFAANTALYLCQRDLLENDGEFPNSQLFNDEGLILPCGPEQPMENVDIVIAALEDYGARHGA